MAHFILVLIAFTGMLGPRALGQQQSDSGVPDPSKAIAMIHERGGKYVVDKKDPKQPVIEVILQGTGAVNGDLALLRAFPKLQRLNLARCNKINNVGLEWLEDLKELRVLRLNSCSHVSDGGMEFVGKLTNLEELYLDQTIVTDFGLKELKELKKLKKLSLIDALAQGRGLESSIPGLEIINIAGQGNEPGRITPASGGVELEEINIVRRTALGAVAGADLTNMELRLYFPGVWKRPETGVSPDYLIRFESLASIEDDTGKILSTEQRLNQIQYLRGEVQAKSSNDGKGGGPIAGLLLEAPARKAEKIRAIKGKAHVSLCKRVNLTFNNLAAINGKVLEHPDMKGLHGLKLKFSVEEKDGKVAAKVSAPVKYTSPWNLGRLHRWDLLNGQEEIDFSSEAVSPDNEGIAVEKTYDRPSFKGFSLRLVVLDPVENKTFNFDFRNVDLP